MVIDLDPDDRSRILPYWEALGQFVHYYSRVEGAMKETLRVVTCTSPETARALFSGVRVRGAIDTVRRTLKERGRPLPPKLDEALSKIAAITTQRDRILHYGIQFDDEGDYVSDDRFQVVANARTTPITVHDLNDMTADTLVVWARLVVYNESLRRGPWPWRKGWVEASKRPWRYTPPQPVRDQDKSRDTKPRPSRRQKSSPA